MHIGISYHKQPVASVAWTCLLSHSLKRAARAANGGEPAAEMGVGVGDGSVVGGREA